MNERPTMSATPPEAEAPGGMSSTLHLDANAIPAPPPADVWPIEMPLIKAIRNKDGDEVKTLSFREPMGEDIVACGVPVRVIWETGAVQFDAIAMNAMMSRLSLTPLPFIAKMHPIDWVTCATRLQDFFLPDLIRLGLVRLSPTATD